MTHRHPSTVECAGCGIPLSDGYTIGCKQCGERRGGRLRRGTVFSPTGYAGEVIDSRTVKGRIVAGLSALLACEDRAVCACGSDHLCSCGCGEVLANLARAHALVAAGATHARAAEIMGVSREYVSVLHRKPPRYIIGHYRLPPEGYAKQRETHRLRRESDERSRERWVLEEAILSAIEGNLRWSAHPTFFTYKTVAKLAPSLLASVVQERCKRNLIAAEIRPLGWRRYFRAQQVEWARQDTWQAQLRERWLGLVRDLRAAERATARDLLARQIESDRAERRWIRLATSEQRRILARKEKLRREVQRRVDAEDRMGNTLFPRAISLDAEISSEEGAATFHNFIGGERLAIPIADEPINQLQRDSLWEIVGDADIEHLDDHELERLREKLRAAGINGPAVQRSERDRLRDPDAHTGSGIQGSKSLGSNTKRRAKVAAARHGRPSRKPRKRWSRPKPE